MHEGLKHSRIIVGAVSHTHRLLKQEDLDESHFSYAVFSAPAAAFATPGSTHLTQVKSRETAKSVVVGGKSGGGTPGPISNPAVKPTSAHGSLGFTHARVGHRQRQPFCSSLCFLLPFFLPVLPALHGVRFSLSLLPRFCTAYHLLRSSSRHAATALSTGAARCTACARHGTLTAGGILSHGWERIGNDGAR
jgi:hypothetical protein